MSHRTTRQQKARALQAETGWNYMRALNEVDRRYAEERAQFTAGAETLQSEGLTAAQLERVVTAEPELLVTHPPVAAAFPDAVFREPRLIP